jgi:hypothetical protein
VSDKGYCGVFLSLLANNEMERVRLAVALISFARVVRQQGLGTADQVARNSIDSMGHHW